ncbi:MAG TPA: esterase-like activity of phytase family protein, partial [Sphingomicrobium sp.]
REALDWKDLKICELTAVGERTLLVLERSSETCKIYRIELRDDLRTPSSHFDIETSPTIEELSASGQLELPLLTKELLFTSDEHREVAADIEGMTLLSDRSLLLVSDNDYGVEEKRTCFYRLVFDEPFATV